MVDANQRWDVGEAIARMRDLARFNPWWIEEPTSPDDVLGHAAIARGGGADRRRHRRTLRQPRHLQAAAAGRGDQLLPDRQLPARRRQREPGGHADGGEVRRPGLPARRRRRPVRDGAASRDVRLPRDQRYDGAARRRIRRSSARALRRSSRRPPRPLHGADAAGLQHRDQGARRAPCTASRTAECGLEEGLRAQGWAQGNAAAEL